MQSISHLTTLVRLAAAGTNTAAARVAKAAPTIIGRWGALELTTDGELLYLVERASPEREGVFVAVHLAEAAVQNPVAYEAAIRRLAVTLSLRRGSQRQPQTSANHNNL